MASSLETKVLFDYNSVELSRPEIHQHTQQTKIKPVIKSLPSQQSAPLRKQYSKLTLGLIGVAFALLTTEAVIYFHSVQVQKNSNLMQTKIVAMKEQNYRLNVELAKTKELTKVEKIAETTLQMKPSLTSKINYLILPETVTKKEYLITSVLPAQRKLSIPIGF